MSNPHYASQTLSNLTMSLSTQGGEGQMSEERKRAHKEYEYLVNYRLSQFPEESVFDRVTWVHDELDRKRREREVGVKTQDVELERQRFINEKFLSIPELYQTASFNLFNIETEEDKSNLNSAMQVVDKFNIMKERGSNVVFYGTTGNGKTFLAWCIFKELTKKGFNVQYIKADNMILDINYLRYSAPQRERKHPDDIIKKYTRSDLLIIDEIGNHSESDGARNILFSILDDRNSHKKPMLCITNQNEKNLIHYLGDAGYSRIRTKGKMIPFTGKDRRITK